MPAATDRNKNIGVMLNPDFKPVTNGRSGMSANKSGGAKPAANRAKPGQKPGQQAGKKPGNKPNPGQGVMQRGQQLIKINNPSRDSMNLLGLLLTAGVVSIAVNGANTLLVNQSATMRLIAKGGLGWVIQKYGSKVPYIGPYTTLAGILLIVSAFQDAIDTYGAPYLQKLPVVGAWYAPAAPLQQLPAGDGVGALVRFPANSPLNQGMGMGGIVRVGQTSTLGPYMVQR